MHGRHDTDVEVLLSAYRDGELSGAEREVVEEALRKDPALQARLEDHEALGWLVQASLEREADEVDFTGFADSVLERLPAGRPSHWKRFQVWLQELLTYHRWQAVSALAAVVLLLVAGPLVWNTTQGPGTLRDQGPLLASGPGMAQILEVSTPEDTDAMLFKTASGTTVIYVQGN